MGHYVGADSSAPTGNMRVPSKKIHSQKTLPSLWSILAGFIKLHFQR